MTGTVYINNKCVARVNTSKIYQEKICLGNIDVLAKSKLLLFENLQDIN